MWAVLSGKLYALRQALWNNSCWLWSEEGVFLPIRLTETLGFYLCSSVVLSSGCCLSLSMKAYVSLNDFFWSISQRGVLLLSLLLTEPLETSFVCGMIVCTAKTRGRTGIFSHFWKIVSLKDPKEPEEMVQKVARTLGQESLAYFLGKHNNPLVLLFAYPSWNN